MITALLAAGSIGALFVVAANPLWLGAITKHVIRHIPFPIPLEITVSAVSLTGFQLLGIRIILSQWIWLSVDSVSLSLWPLRLSVSNVRGRLQYTERPPIPKFTIIIPSILEILLHHVTSLAIKMLSIIQFEINRIEIQISPQICMLGNPYPTSFSIHQICIKKCRTCYISYFHCVGLGSTAAFKCFQAEMSFLLDSRPRLSASISDIQVNILQCISAQLSVIDIQVFNNSVEALAHILTASGGSERFLFLGQVLLSTDLHNLFSSATVFGARLDLDPLIGIMATLKPYLICMLPLTMPKPKLKFSVYSAGIAISAMQKTMTLACIEELQVNSHPDYEIYCRNARTGSNLMDFVRVSSIFLLPSASQIRLAAGDTTIHASFEITTYLMPVTQLFLEIAQSIPASQSPPAPVNVNMTTGMIQIVMPRLFGVGIQSSKFEISQKKFSLHFMEPECLYDSSRFLSFSFVDIAGQKENSSCPHPTIDITADVARGHWSPLMQYDLLFLIKEIIAAVIKAKHAFYPLLFPSSDQLPTPQPAHIARGLPPGEQPFYDWAFRDRAPYLVEKLQIISLGVSDILITAAIDSSIMLTFYAERFLSDFIPWHWHVESFPLLHVVSLDISRDCSADNVTLSDLKCDPELTEQTSKLLMYSPIRISSASVTIRVPSSDSSLYDSVDPLSILFHTRGLAQSLNSLPTLDDLTSHNNGPGYKHPPDFVAGIHGSIKCAQLVLMSVWVPILGLEICLHVKRLAQNPNRRELLRLKIREHQRRTGQLVSDAKISLMSSRLAESNFELFRSRIAHLKAKHAEKWSFPHLDRISEDLRPGNFRLGSLMAVSIHNLRFKLQIVEQTLLKSASKLLLAAECSMQSESLQVSLRQFCPPVVDILKCNCSAHISVQEDYFGPIRSCDLCFSPRHRIQFTQPLYPPLISVRVYSVDIDHPNITFSPTLDRTLKDIMRLFMKMRPSFIDPNLRLLSILDVVRYIFEIKKLDNVLVTNFSLRMLQNMAFCTSTDSPFHSSLLIKGSDFKTSFNPTTKSLSFSIGEFSLGISDNRNDSRTKVHMSHEYVNMSGASDGNVDNEFYETGVLLQCYRICSSVKVTFISATGVPCLPRRMDNQSEIEAVALDKFQTSRLAVLVKLSVGSSKQQTKVAFNIHNLSSLLLILRPLGGFNVPDISGLQLSCSQLSMLNCSFTLLNAETNDDPGQGFRLNIDEVESKFDFNLCAIHNLYINVSSLNAYMIANDAFWRKCKTGHELAHDIRNGTVVVVHTFENQRFILGQGWLSRLLPTDRPNWSDIDGMQELRRDSSLFDLPSDHWHWKSDWVIDRGQLCGKGKVDSDGWEYAHDFPRSYTAKRHWTDNVRRRRWFRVRRLIDSVDKNIRTILEEKRNRRQNGLLFLVDGCEIAQKPCSTLIIRAVSPMQSPSKLATTIMSANPALPKPFTTLLSFFSIGTQQSPNAHLYTNSDFPESSFDGDVPIEEPEHPVHSSPYLFSLRIMNPKARMTLESRNSLVQLYRTYMLHFEYYLRLRSAPTADNTDIIDDEHKSGAFGFSADENSDDNENAPDEGLGDFVQSDDDDIEPLAKPALAITKNPEPESINPVNLIDIVSIEIVNGQIAVESPVESGCGIILACMQSCFITARSFDSGGEPKQKSERVELRLLMDNLTIRLAPTDIDVDAKPMWFDFKESSNQSVMKAIVDPFPIQACAMFYPFSASPHNIFLLLPTVNITLDRLQCALLESIITHVALAELPLPPLQSVTEFVRFSCAGWSALDGRITSHQRVLWQIRHLEWLMEVYSVSDPADENVQDPVEAGEIALLSAHLSSLRQQFLDSIMSVSIDLHAHISLMFSTNPLDLHFRLEACLLSLVSVNRIEFVRTTVGACSGLVQIDFKGEGSLKIGFEIRDLRVVDSRTEMEDWKVAVIPAYLCSSNGVATGQNGENRAVLTLQCVVKRVGGIIVICSCVLNVTHLVVRITQSLVDDFAEFFTKQATSSAEKKKIRSGASLVPQISGVLSQIDHPGPSSQLDDQFQDGAFFEEAAPAHLRDLRLYCERSQNSIIITYLKIGPIRATVSFKGIGSSAMADFQGMAIRMPAMIYQKKTWTLRKFTRRLRRDLIKASLRQAGPGLASFLKYKFGGGSTDMGSWNYGSHEDLNALDIDLPVGSIPIQPSPHPITKSKAAVGDLINKFKATASDIVAASDQSEEEKDPDKRVLLFGKPTTQ